jgi:exopolysaccharide biosynthesis protein
VTAVLAGGYAAQAGDVVSTPYLGITLHQRTETSPRPLKINVLEINLGATGLSFRVTPSNGAAEGESTKQTTRAYLNQVGAQFAINASFFGNVGSTGADNVGLAASNGNAYSPFSDGFFALNITSANSAAIVKQASPDFTGFTPDPLVPIYNAVSGDEKIVTNGANTATSTTLNPRTAAGIASGNRLILMTVDGRQPGVSEGVTKSELANLLLGYGVSNGINLDGGGSTTMAMAGLSSPLNVPSDGFERAVGTNLAIFASPVPEPGTVAAAVLMAALVLPRRQRKAVC